MRFFRTRVAFAILTGLVVVACAGSASSGGSKEPEPDSSRSDTEQPIPTDLQQAVEQALQAGRAIFAQDVASALATEAMLSEKHLPQDERVSAWLTLPTEQGWQVLFVGAREQSWMALYQVRLMPREKPVVNKLNPPEDLGPEASHRLRAGQTAAQEQFLTCSNRYNRVVLPASLLGKLGWLVYLLPAPQSKNVLLVGGHHRFHISANGARVIAHLPLAKSCLTIPLDDPPSGAKTAGVMVTHIVQDSPSEAHVFLSLLHEIPLYVATRRGLWRVQESGIDYLGARR
jgi:hypothetical protein